jgi:ribosome-binding factor A
MKEQSKRQMQFSSVLRNAVARHITTIFPMDLSSPQSLFSIGRVTMSPDLKNAKIEIECAKESAEKILSDLKKFSPAIKRKIAPLLSTKYMPKIQFIHSKSAEISEHIRHMMESVKKDAEA